MAPRQQGVTDHDIIQDNYQLLVDNVFPRDLCPVLQGCDLLTDDDVADIRIAELRHGRERAVATMTDIIKIYGLYCYPKFIQCLYRVGYRHIAEKLQREIWNTNTPTDLNDENKIKEHQHRGRTEVERRNREYLVKLGIKINKDHNTWVLKRKELIKGLQDLAEKFDSCRFYSNVGSVIGSTVSTVFGLGCIGLVVLSMASGVGIIVCVAGVVVGSTVSVGSSLVEIGFTQAECERFQKVLNQDKVYTEQLIQTLEQYNDKKNRFIETIERTNISDQPLSKINKQTTIRCQKTAAGILVYEQGQDLYKQIPSAAISSLTTATGFAGVNGRVLEKAKVVGGGFGGSVAAVVVAGVSTALDISTMVSVVNDMKHGSKSECAEKFRKMAILLSKDKDRIQSIIPRECEI